jgi:hypothetical protein
VTRLVIDDDDVPYSTREIAGSLVVHVITADVVPGLAISEEITGSVVSATGGFKTIVAVSYFAVLAPLVARTIIVCLLVTEAGAVYKPVEEILPTKGLMDHVTARLVVPDTAATN